MKKYLLIGAFLSMFFNAQPINWVVNPDFEQKCYPTLMTYPGGLMRIDGPTFNSTGNCSYYTALPNNDHSSYANNLSRLGQYSLSYYFEDWDSRCSKRVAPHIFDEDIPPSAGLPPSSPTGFDYLTKYHVSYLDERTNLVNNDKVYMALFNTYFCDTHPFNNAENSSKLGGKLIGHLPQGCYTLDFYRAASKWSFPSSGYGLNKIEVRLKKSIAPCDPGKLIYTSPDITSTTWINDPQLFTIDPSEHLIYDRIEFTMQELLCSQAPTITLYEKSLIEDCGEHVTFSQAAFIDEISIEPYSDPQFGQAGYWCLSDVNLSGLPNAGMTGISFTTSAPFSSWIPANGYFIPANAPGPGNYVVTRIDASGVCPVYDYFTITIEDEPIVTIGTQTWEFCSDDPPFTISPPAVSSAVPYLSSWYDPNGIQLPNGGHTLDPNLWHGTNNFTFCAWTQNAQCSTCVVIPVKVTEKPSLIINIPAEICENDESFILPTFPQGGNWVGLGVVYSAPNYVFDPSLVAPNTGLGYLISYNIVVDNCPFNYDFYIKVYAKPTPIYQNLGTICHGEVVNLGSNGTFTVIEFNGTPMNASITGLYDTKNPPVGLYNLPYTIKIFAKTPVNLMPEPNSVYCDQETTYEFTVEECPCDAPPSPLTYLATSLNSFNSEYRFSYSYPSTLTGNIRWGMVLIDPSIVNNPRRPIPGASGTGLPPAWTDVDFFTLFGLTGVSNYQVCVWISYELNGVQQYCEWCDWIEIGHNSGQRKASPKLTSSPEKTPNNLQVYPNPSSGEFNIQFGESGEGALVVYNFQGQLIKSIQIKDGMESTQLDLSDQSNGVYLIEINQGNQLRRTKIVKK